MFVMTCHSFQWLNQITPNNLSCLYILLIAEKRHDMGVGLEMPFQVPRLAFWHQIKKYLHLDSQAWRHILGDHSHTPSKGIPVAGVWLLRMFTVAAC